MNGRTRSFAPIAIGLAVAIGAAHGASRTAAPKPAAASLEITIVGHFERVVLRDPSRRLNFVTEAGRESTFAGCFRSFTPIGPGLTEDADWIQFNVDQPLDGKYTVSLVARDTGWVRFEVRGEFGRMGRADAGVLRAQRGKRMRGEVLVELPTANEGDRFDVRLTRPESVRWQGRRAN